MQSTEYRIQSTECRLRAEYSRCVRGPATALLDTFTSHTLTEVLDGKGWIVPCLLRYNQSVSQSISLSVNN